MLEGTDKTQALEWVLEKMSAAKKAKKGTSASAPKFKTKTFEPPAPKKDLTSKKQTELEMWKTWKKSDYDKAHLQPLLKSLTPFINSYVNKYKGRVEIPASALEFEGKRLAVNALKDYKPSQKTALSTWVGWNLNKLSRFVNKTQNFARIPENLSRHIGTYKAVKADLSDRLGHEPDDITLYEEASKIDDRISLGTIKRLNKEIRKGLISANHEGFEASNVTQDDRHKEVQTLIWHQLSPQERVVHEYTFGLNGKPELGTGAIAKKLKWDPSKVSKMKTSIANKMKPFLEP